MRSETDQSPLRIDVEGPSKSTTSPENTKDHSLVL